LKPTAVLLVLLLAPLAAAQAPPDHTPVDLAHAASIAGRPRAPRLTGEALEAEAKRIAALLRFQWSLSDRVRHDPAPS